MCRIWEDPISKEILGGKNEKQEKAEETISKLYAHLAAIACSDPTEHLDFYLLFVLIDWYKQKEIEASLKQKHT